MECLLQGTSAPMALWHPGGRKPLQSDEKEEVWEENPYWTRSTPTEPSHCSGAWMEMGDELWSLSIKCSTCWVTDLFFFCAQSLGDFFASSLITRNRMSNLTMHVAKRCIQCHSLSFCMTTGNRMKTVHLNGNSSESSLWNKQWVQNFTPLNQTSHWPSLTKNIKPVAVAINSVKDFKWIVKI